MRRTYRLGAWTALTVLALAAGCRGKAETVTPTADRFAADVAFLRQHSEIVVLDDGSGARAAVAPAYQGRVMTSTTGGPAAPSFGWIGRAAVEAGSRQPHMNVFGGEDRFWLGPEGGRYALYFKPGDPFDLDHWQTPEPFDWGAWEVASQSPAQVTFHKRMALSNYAGTRFDIDVERTVRLLPAAEVARQIGAADDGSLRIVAFESSNTVANAGDTAWQRDSGLVSIWILGQFTPSPRATIVIPYAPGTAASAGAIVNDKYFGPVPADRLAIGNNALFFKADGQHRAKIGLSPARALDTAGSYDPDGGVLTLVQYSRPGDDEAYVNSMWNADAAPYAGDVVNSYNDGPAAPGKPPLGPFYELETSSPALALAPGGRYTHIHRTIHVRGPLAGLDRIARSMLKVSLAQVTCAFSSHCAAAQENP